MSAQGVSSASHYYKVVVCELEECSRRFLRAVGARWGGVGGDSLCVNLPRNRFQPSATLRHYQFSALFSDMCVNVQSSYKLNFLGTGVFDI
jgi:hypothetical protein